MHMGEGCRRKETGLPKRGVRDKRVGSICGLLLLRRLDLFGQLAFVFISRVL